MATEDAVFESGLKADKKAKRAKPISKRDEESEDTDEDNEEGEDGDDEFEGDLYDEEVGEDDDYLKDDNEGNDDEEMAEQKPSASTSHLFEKVHKILMHLNYMCYFPCQMPVSPTRTKKLSKPLAKHPNPTPSFSQNSNAFGL